MSKYNVPFCDTFLDLAKKVNQLEAMEYILKYQEKKDLQKEKVHAAIFEVGQHASQKRFYLFNGKENWVKQYHVAHGSGSEGDKNDGWADQFSNKPGSNATSLGLYLCAEDYIGKNGRSLKLDGLEATNSNARARSVVIHGAKYVTENGAEAGDSHGCPALDHAVVQDVINRLIRGSYLYIYVRPKVVVAPTPVVPEKTAKKLLWYPKALIRKDLKKPSKGQYKSKSGLSVGSIVHFTAGNYSKGKQNAIDTIDGSPYSFHCIATDGTFVQANPINEWGYHAGISAWKINGKKVSSVSDYLDGIEMNNPGRLEKIAGKYYSYFNKKTPIDPKFVNVVSKDDDNIQAGYYMKYTPQQIETLIDYLCWRKFNDPENYNFDYVLGHDEVAGKKGIGYNRKNDPGGALPMNMTKFRELLKKTYLERYGSK